MIVDNKLNIKELLYKEKYASKLIRKKIFKNIGVKQMMSIKLISTLLSGFFNDEYLWMTYIRNEQKITTKYTPWKFRPFFERTYPDKKIDAILKTKQRRIILEKAKGFASTFRAEKPYIFNKLKKTIAFAK